MDTPIQLISHALSLPVRHVQQTVALFQEGATIPFIARYRKEMTGGLDEVQIRDILTQFQYYTELDARKATIRKSMEEQGVLTPELAAKIEACRDKQVLEDLYLPFKPRRKTRADAAVEKGLLPLAEFLLAQKNVAKSKEAILDEFVNAEKGISTREDALAGAQDIIAQRVADTGDFRQAIRKLAAQKAIVATKVTKAFQGQKSKFEMYYDFSEPLARAAGHRILAIRRGEKEGVLKWQLTLNHEECLHFLLSRVAISPSFAFKRELAAAVQDGYERLLFPSIETECFNAACEAAEAASIEVFSANLKNLLLAPPAGHKVIMGMDPGFRTGCKVAVVDEMGTYKINVTIYPHEPQKKAAEAADAVLKLIKHYGVSLIAIGNGTASRETMAFVRTKVLPKAPDVVAVTVSEAGASVYSASELAGKEFPELDLTVRGAISIARRLQDPLAELVKIDPKSIGVGQYQHDVNQTQLKEALAFTTEYCVNRVGVDVNTASGALLTYVAGIGPAVAANIVRYREENGAFKDRKMLLKVAKLGPKAFEQCAGFLRVKNGKNVLDNSAIHPESYAIAEAMAADLGVKVVSLIGNEALIATIKPEKYVTDKVGLPTLRDIIQELKKPGLDPRDRFDYAQFDDNVTSIEDLKEGMEMEGVVTNVTNFGAFVDIGVHQDGLVHISKLSDRFVKNPHEVVAVGQAVKVKVIGVDKALKRIQLERVLG